MGYNLAFKGLINATKDSRKVGDTVEERANVRFT